MDTKAYAAWMKAGMDMWMLGAEAGTVMTLRMARIAAGGRAGTAEARLMVSEEGPRRDRAPKPAYGRGDGHHAARRHASHAQALPPQGSGQQAAIAMTADPDIPVWCFTGRTMLALTDDEAGHALPADLGPWTFRKCLTITGSNPDEAEALHLIRDHGFCCFDPVSTDAER